MTDLLDLPEPLTVASLTERYSILFTPEALVALDTLKTDKAYLIVNNHEILNLTHFVGQVSLAQEYFLAKEIANAFNDLVSKGMVKGVLCPLSTIALSPDNMEKKVGVFLFAHIDDPKKYVQEKYSHLTAPEGEVGELHVY